MNKLLTFQEIKKKIADYCVYQDRCQQEVYQKMKEFELIPEAKDEIFLFLHQYDFLNEERFAKNFARGKFNQKKWGKQKIAFHLKQKNISDKLITMALQEIDEKYYDVFYEVATEKWESLVEKNIAVRKKKLYNYLAQKGFENNLIYQFSTDN